MSDPTPGFHNLSLSDAPANKVLPPAVQTQGLAATIGNAIADIGQRLNHGQQQAGAQHAANYRMRMLDNSHFMRDENIAVDSSPLISQQTVMFNHSGNGPRSPHLDDDPNTDGAFGDMDM